MDLEGRKAATVEPRTSWNGGRLTRRFGSFVVGVKWGVCCTVSGYGMTSVRVNVSGRGEELRKIRKQFNVPGLRTEAGTRVVGVGVGSDRRVRELVPNSCSSTRVEGPTRCEGACVVW
jgi:hypothetical protein